jgi:DNA-binding GntR family transcriptional regulator
MLKPAAATKGQAIQRPTLERRSSADRVVGAIADGIRAGRYVPGQRLIEGDLTQNLGVSRGPVREALGRLAAEGVVTLTLHRGAYIRALSRDEAKKLLMVLEVLNGLAARLAAAHVPDTANKRRMREALINLEQTYARGATVTYIEKTQEFFDTIIAIGGNEQIARIFPTMQIHLMRLQFSSFWSEEETKFRFNDYSLITAAILEGDAKGAEREVRLHIRKAREAVDRLPGEAFPVPISDYG